MDQETYYQIENFEINGKFPIHLAAIQGSYEIMSFLLSKSFHINKIDSDGNSALYYAIK